MSNKDKMETTQSQQAVDMQASGKKHTVLYIIRHLVDSCRNRLFGGSQLL